jgi:hypothetical protein
MTTAQEQKHPARDPYPFETHDHRTGKPLPEPEDEADDDD